MICSYYMYSCASGAESASCKLSLQVSCLKFKKEVSYKGSILALNDVVRQSVERRCLFAKFLKCSLPNGYKYPASEGTACAGDYIKCKNRDSTTFYCGAKSTCCGDICVGEEGSCCQNSNDNNFACGAGSSCR